MNTQQFLENLIGSRTSGSTPPAAAHGGGLETGSGWAGIAGGLAAGGLLGLLVGNKKARKKMGKLAGGMVGYGGAATLGAMGYRAYQDWQAGKRAGMVDGPPVSMPVQTPPEGSKFLPDTAPAGDGRPFELALIVAMIAAANADGHIGAEEQRAIFDQVGQLSLDSEGKAVVFDTLRNPPSLQDIASLASGPEQAAEIYLASRLAIDPDHPAEVAYLEALANRLRLPPELVKQLESQVVQAG
jgi:uncharacterized membrane protein YebE (DUF533 family)